MLRVVGGQLWKQFGSGTWYTVEECGPGLYRYVYREGEGMRESGPNKGCLLVLAGLCFFWAAVLLIGAHWLGWL